DEFKINGKVERIPRERGLIKPGAMPLLLNKYPSYYQPKVAERKPPSERSEIVNAKKKKQDSTATSDVEILGTENNDVDAGNFTTQDIDLKLNEIDNNNEDGRKSSSPEETWSCSLVPNMQLPTDWVCCNTLNEKEKFVAHINSKTLVIDKTVNFVGNSLPEIKIRGTLITSVQLPSKICTVKDAEKIVNKVDQIRVCAGTGTGQNLYSVSCEGGVSQHQKRCTHCAAKRVSLIKKQMRMDKAEDRKQKKKLKMKNTLSSLKRSKSNLLEMIKKYKIKLENMQAECGEKNELVL
ncbi:Threonine synthase, partial [Frankliniella fusca]